MGRMIRYLETRRNLLVLMSAALLVVTSALKVKASTTGLMGASLSNPSNRKIRRGFRIRLSDGSTRPAFSLKSGMRFFPFLSVEHNESLSAEMFTPKLAGLNAPSFGNSYLLDAATTSGSSSCTSSTGGGSGGGPTVCQSEPWMYPSCSEY